MNRELVKGVAIGVGVSLIAPYLFPALGRAAKPALQAAIRSGVLAWERSREQMAELGEYAEDVVAEARAGDFAAAAAADTDRGDPQ